VVSLTASTEPGSGKEKPMLEAGCIALLASLLLLSGGLIKLCAKL
jgi:hypothetical protein